MPTIEELQTQVAELQALVVPLQTQVAALRAALAEEREGTQLLKRAKIRETLREMGSRFGDVRQHGAAHNQVREAIAAAATAWDTLDAETREAAAVVGEALTRLTALDDELQLLATAIGRTAGLWHTMPQKERDDLAAEEPE
jgi:uncharacterized coiled-coil protein SlyX